MGSKTLLSPENLAKNSSDNCLLHQRGDIRFSCIPFRSFSALNKWSEAKVVLQATEWKMMWLVLDGSQMNECIFDFWLALKWSCIHKTFCELLQSECIFVWFYFMCHALLSFSVRAPCCTDSLVDTGLFCFLKPARILFLVLMVFHSRINCESLLFCKFRALKINSQNDLRSLQPENLSIYKKGFKWATMKMRNLHNG